MRRTIVVTVEARLRCSTLKALLLYPPHTIVVRPYGHGVSYVFLLIPEPAGLLDLREVAGQVGRIRHSG